MKKIVLFALCGLLYVGRNSPASALTYDEYPSIRLRTLDKITARTTTFDAQVGNTVKFGDIYIKIQSCRKPPPVEKKESSAFLQIWQVDKVKEESKWIFSGWMFASSPALSGMEHPVYDVWVIDCLGKDPEALPVEETKHDEALPDEGTVPEDSVIKPETTPEEQKTENVPLMTGEEGPLPKKSSDQVDGDMDYNQPYSPSRGSDPKAEQQPDHQPEKEPIDGIY